LFCSVEEKTWCWLVVIPLLVFDCVALQLIEGIVGFPERMGTCFSYALGNVWTLLGSLGILSSLKRGALSARYLHRVEMAETWKRKSNCE